MIAEPLVAVDDVAAHLSLEENYICRSIETKRLTATKVVRLWKLQVSAVGDGGRWQDCERLEGGPYR